MSNTQTRETQPLAGTGSTQERSHMLEGSRPLSPYLHYRWQYTNTLSILHRATGIILSIGFLLLVYGITAIASGPAAYARAAILLSYPVGKALLGFVLLAFAYHLCN